MRVISIRNKIREISRRWNEHHENYGYHPSAETLEKHNAEIGRRLAAIDPETATAAEVNEIIGDEKWTRPQRCFECDGVFDAVIDWRDLQQSVGNRAIDPWTVDRFCTNTAIADRWNNTCPQVRRYG